MGAELICYIVKVKEVDGDTAVREVKNYFDTLRPRIQAIVDAHQVKTVTDILDAVSVERIRDGVASLCDDLGIVQDACDEEEYLSLFEDIRSTYVDEDSIEELITLPLDARDLQYRGLPSDRIVVAGERTWGDEPDGDGFQHFKLTSMLGLWHILGYE